jgi:RHS repeat-associated protein
LITDLDGNVVQHVEYVPFGEVFIEERNNKWNTPYLFNAKELDEETGLYYYGARYYDGRTATWLGVDPMWEKYPGMSVYAYCSNNPIKYIDPDGQDHYYTEDGVYLGQDKKETQNVWAANKYHQLENGSYVITGKNQINDNQGNAMTHDQFKDLAGTLYAEATLASQGGSWQECAAIYSVLENRANATDDKEGAISTYKEAQINGVYGWPERGKITNKNAEKQSVQNAYKGLIKGALDDTDYSGGAYYWDGTDYKTTARYTAGTVFSKSEHNLWKAKDNAKEGKNKYGSWSSVYETTDAKGKTTFSRLTDAYLNTRYPKKKASWTGQ